MDGHADAVEAAAAVFVEAAKRCEQSAGKSEKAAALSAALALRSALNAAITDLLK